MAFVALVVVAAAHDAGAAGVTRVVVRVTDSTSQALMQRIRGQTSDLDVALVEATEPAMEARVSEEVATADRLGRASGARVVVWFEQGAAGLTLLFCIPDERRTLVRTIANEGPAGPSSATYESAALVVRSVLRAVANGATIGLTLAAPLDLPPAEAASPPPSPPRHDDAPEPPPPSPAREVSWSWTASVGWRAAFVERAAVVQGADARGGACVARLCGGLAGLVDASSELADAAATVKLLRVGGAAFVAYALPIGGDRWRLAIGLGGGAVGFRRETVRVASGVAATPPAWTASPLVAPELAIAYRVRGAGVWWGLGLRAGVDVVLTPPLIGAQTGAGFTEEHALWTAEPKAVLEARIGGP